LCFGGRYGRVLQVPARQGDTNGTASTIDIQEPTMPEENEGEDQEEQEDHEEEEEEDDKDKVKVKDRTASSHEIKSERIRIVSIWILSHPAKLDVPYPTVLLMIIDI